MDGMDFNLFTTYWEGGENGADGDGIDMSQDSPPPPN